MTSEPPRKRAWCHLIAVVSLAVSASLINLYGNAQDLSTHRTWQIGAFAAGGFPPAYEVHSPGFHYGLQLDLLNAGVQIGKMLAVPHGPGFFRGQGEALVEVMPFWLAYYPRQTLYVHIVNSPDGAAGPYGPYSRYGASITPLLVRWNLAQRTSTRSTPWAQLGGGLLWTNDDFPLLLYGESTSAINFTPQVGIGENVFVRKNRSLDFAIKAVHISNAGLGDHNPGLNVTLQFSAGYSWWK